MGKRPGESYICSWWVKDLGNRIDVAKSYICSWWVKDLGNRIDVAKSYICSWWVVGGLKTRGIGLMWQSLIFVVGG